MDAELGPSTTERLDAIEPQLPQIAQVLSQHGATLDQVAQQVMWLSQQRAMAELQMERNTRATALDLAIKASGEKPDVGVIVEFAEAFLGWMKAGAS
jgi:hypothetical protein